jgi:hypothetical protein
VGSPGYDELTVRAERTLANRFGELGHAICIGHTLYAFTILDYGHPERLLGPAPKSLETSMLLGSIAVTSGTCIDL